MISKSTFLTQWSSFKYVHKIELKNRHFGPNRFLQLEYQFLFIKTIFPFMLIFVSIFDFEENIYIYLRQDLRYFLNFKEKAKVRGESAIVLYCVRPIISKSTFFNQYEIPFKFVHKKVKQYILDQSDSYSLNTNFYL